MKEWTKYFLVFLVFAFAAGTVTNVTSSTVMAVEMSKMDMVHGSSDAGTDERGNVDCDGCPGTTESASVCQFDCTAPFAAILAADLVRSVPTRSRDDGVHAVARHEHTAAIEPEPPRNLS